LTGSSARVYIQRLPFPFVFLSFLLGGITSRVRHYHIQKDRWNMDKRQRWQRDVLVAVGLLADRNPWRQRWGRLRLWWVWR